MNPNFGKALREKIIEAYGGNVGDFDKYADLFQGCTPEQIEEIKTSQNVSFLPDIYYQFLVELGRKSGPLYSGYEAHYPVLLDFKTIAKSILTDNKEITYELPEDAFVFSIHSYQFTFFCTQHRADDPAVFLYNESGEPKLRWNHLSEFLTLVIREKLGIAAHKEFLAKYTSSDS